MKTITFLLLLFASINFVAQTTYVPDDNFEQALIDLGYDDVLDDYVLTANIDTVTSLDVSEKNINDLTGIEDFTALIELKCSNNQLTSLDISQNTALNHLECPYNQFTSLDVSQNMALNYFWCAYNQLTSLDVSQNTALYYLGCYANQLTSLDVSQNTALTGFSCSSNALTNIDVSQNTALVYLWCYNNQLTTLDVLQNTALEIMYCGENHLTALDLRNGSNQNITHLDTTGSPDLTCIFVDDAAWSQENWGYNYIDCYTYYVETEVECDAISPEVYVPDDNFEQVLIDLGHDDILDDYVNVRDVCGIGLLSIFGENISDLTGIERFRSLGMLLCNSNNLTDLDLSNNLRLIMLICDNNDLLNLDIRNGTNTNISTFTADNNPNLTCIFVDDAAYSTANWTDIDPASTFVETQAECDALLEIDDEVFAQKTKIYPNPTTGKLYIKCVENDANLKITVFNILGEKIIESFSNNEIDISDLQDGIYFVNVEDAERSNVTYKVIKK